MIQNDKATNKNYEIFNTIKFDQWASRQNIIFEEKYLFEKYVFPLNKNKNILDVGTGNGRFLYEMASEGFRNLQGIDLAERLLSVAKEQLLTNYPFIKLTKMSVSNLEFNNNVFDVIFGLQQIISFVEDKNERIKAFSECYRVLKPDGFFIASFLHYEGRWYNLLISSFVLPIKIFRMDINFLKYKYLPWLQLDRKINFSYFYKKQPYLYWFNTDEIVKILKEVGFKILEIKTTKMIINRLDNFKTGGMLYIVAKK